jgi:hypothetical protein
MDRMSVKVMYAVFYNISNFLVNASNKTILIFLCNFVRLSLNGDYHTTRFFLLIFKAIFHV